MPGETLAFSLQYIFSLLLEVHLHTSYSFFSLIFNTIAYSGGKPSSGQGVRPKPIMIQASVYNGWAVLGYSTVDKEFQVIMAN